jgi:hypothetical protein
LLNVSADEVAAGISAVVIFKGGGGVVCLMERDGLRRR